MTGRTLRPGGLILAMASLVTAASCTPKVSTGKSVASGGVVAAPHIDRLDPDSARMGGASLAQVTIKGSGFAPGTPGANTIDFAGMMITSVAANAAGTEIAFTVPTRLNRGGEARPQPIMAGSYDIKVTTANGTSNAVALKVLQ